ncbi:MAG: ribonuclease H-like domain-containing protein [Solirubrobacterales bacterium]
MFIKVYDNIDCVAESIENIVYFDIETTGFDKENDKIIMISFGKFNNRRFSIKQYFAEGLNQEKELLSIFLNDIENENTWCSYNGIAFDEPFIKRRMNINKISTPLPLEHVDLYRLIRPYHKHLGLERCNLKTVEKHIGIHRRDRIDGGLSVDLYKEYLDTRNNEIKDIIMLHNYEDVLNLPSIHQFAEKLQNDTSMERDDGITPKQSKYLEFLLSKNQLELCVNLNKISKKAASKIIDKIIKGNINSEEINSIVSNSY